MTGTNRFELIDGLRGVAAMMVVVYHFQPENVPQSVQMFLEQGRLGVDVFFVLSGFVIAHSVRHGIYSFGFLARFGLRRSIRLDPPLWVSILLQVALIRLGMELFPDLDREMPTGITLIANATYTMRFFGLDDAIGVLWSLTYEVQFYLVLVGALVLLQPQSQAGPGRMAISIGFLLALVYSVLVWVGLLPLLVVGLFVDRWFQFALGVAVWLYSTHHLNRVGLALLGGIVLFGAILADSPYRIGVMLMSVLTMSLIAYAAGSNRMQWLSGMVPQFLGRISYSLYLLHIPIGGRAIQVLRRLVDTSNSAALEVLCSLLGVAVSVLAAWVMYRLLEAPSTALARRVSLPSRL